MPKAMAEVLNTCRKALLVIVGEGRSTSAVLRDVANGYRVLRAVANDLTADKSLYLQHVESALADIHPDREYTGEADMALRDVADICLTLARVMNRKTRSDSMKLPEAAMFCQHLRDELRFDQT